MNPFGAALVHVVCMVKVARSIFSHGGDRVSVGNNDRPAGIRRFVGKNVYSRRRRRRAISIESIANTISLLFFIFLLLYVFIFNFFFFLFRPGLCTGTRFYRLFFHDKYIARSRDNNKFVEFCAHSSVRVGQFRDDGQKSIFISLSLSSRTMFWCSTYTRTLCLTRDRSS